MQERTKELYEQLRASPASYPEILVNINTLLETMSQLPIHQKDSAALRLLQGYCYLRQGDFRRANRVFHMAKAQDPELTNQVDYWFKIINRINTLEVTGSAYHPGHLIYSAMKEHWDALIQNTSKLSPEENACQRKMTVEIISTSPFINLCYEGVDISTGKHVEETIHSEYQESKKKISKQRPNSYLKKVSKEDPLREPLLSEI